MLTKFKGIKLHLGGKDYIVPPLNFRALQQLQSRLSEFSGGVDPESIQLVVDCAFLALKRNYDDITEDQVIDLLDLENMQEVMEAVMDVSGLKRKRQETLVVEDSDRPSSGLSSIPT